MADTRLYLSTQPLLPADHGVAQSKKGNGGSAEGASFADMLSAEQQKVSFSRHAISRLQERDISLSPQELEQLDDTVERMAQKGAKESLIYMGDVAFVVSVANKKVITAMDGTSARENIFTNIDSAAII